MLVGVLTALLPGWRDKLISVATDGEATMTGRHGGVQTLMERESTHRVLRVWCALHQIDLVVKAATKDIADGKFYKKAHSFSVHLRAQSNLTTEMKTQCPKDTTRWVAFGNMLQWFIAHRMRLVEHIEANELEDSAPSPAWWVVVYALSPVFDRMNTTIIMLQGDNLVLSQQNKIIAELVASIRFMLEINEGALPDDRDSIIESDCKTHWLSVHSIKNHIADQGSWILNIFSRCNARAKNLISESVGLFCLHLVIGFENVKAERDGNNLPSDLENPPVYPAELVKLRTGAFISNVLNIYRQRIEMFWTDADVNLIEEDHKRLLRAYHQEPLLKACIDGHDSGTLFNDAWDSMPDRFQSLRSFSGGLATAFPNTASVESDFSKIKWEKDPHRASMINLSLAGIMHSKQFQKLCTLNDALNDHSFE